MPAMDHEVQRTQWKGWEDGAGEGKSKTGKWLFVSLAWSWRLRPVTVSDMIGDEAR